MIRAHIVGLEVRGFRRFQAGAKFEFRTPGNSPPDALIVAGPNGSGKSSFLESILFALGRDHLLHRQLHGEHRLRWLRDAVTSNIHVSLRLHVASAPGTVLGTRTPLTLEIIRSTSGWSVSEAGESKPFSDDQNVIRSLLADLPVEWFSSWRQPYLVGSTAPMSVQPDGIGDEMGRLWRVKQRIIDERTRGAFLRDSDGAGLTRDREWLDKLTKSWWALRGEDRSRFIVAADPTDESERHFDIFLQRWISNDIGYDDVCPIDQLSSGELEWLALAGTLITDNSDGIVLVDEPELHLNPEWQARILPALRGVAPTAQLIVATHADAPWDQAYSFERLLLQPTASADEELPNRGTAG